MIEIKNEIPDAFNNSKVGYINKLEGLRLNIEGTFQSGINNGFTNMYFLVALLNVLGILILLGYKDEKILVKINIPICIWKFNELGPVSPLDFIKTICSF